MWGVFTSRTKRASCAANDTCKAPLKEGRTERVVCACGSRKWSVRCINFPLKGLELVERVSAKRTVARFLGILVSEKEGPWERERGRSARPVRCSTVGNPSVETSEPSATAELKDIRAPLVFPCRQQEAVSSEGIRMRVKKSVQCGKQNRRTACFDLNWCRWNRPLEADVLRVSCLADVELNVLRELVVSACFASQNVLQLQPRRDVNLVAARTGAA